MIVYYFNDEKKAYFEGPEEERDKFHPNYTKVSKRPGDEYWYNFDTNEWEKVPEMIKNLWSPRQKNLLKNTSWLLSTEDSPLSVSQKEELKVFRARLVTILDGDVTKKEFPETPEFLKEWIE